MSLTQRKTRPFARGEGSLRDDRLFIVACDDTYAPKQYFNFFRLTRVQVHVVAGTGGAAGAILDALLKVEHEPDDEKWLLLDTDHFVSGTHREGFLAVVRAARDKGIMVALSRPCFEAWLLLHHVDEATVTPLRNAGEVENALRQAIGEYNKTKLKTQHYPLSSVALACIRGKRLDEAVEAEDIPSLNSSRVYKLWQAIIQKALASQLPQALADLKKQGF